MSWEGGRHSSGLSVVRNDKRDSRLEATLVPVVVEITRDLWDVTNLQSYHGPLTRGRNELRVGVLCLFCI